MAEYAAAGKRIELPRRTCPDCGRPMTGWSGYWRWLRDGGLHRVWIRRGRCPVCRSTHALLPDLVHERRLDSVDVIGGALARAVDGTGMRRLAAAMDVPCSTSRDWRRRHRARAPALLALFAGLAVGLGDDLADLPVGTEQAALAALAAAWTRARERRPVGIGGMWRFWNTVCGGRGLATNTGPRLGTDPSRG